MFKTIKDISIYLKKHPVKVYQFRDTSTIDRIVVHQTDTADMGEYSPYYVAKYHVDTNGWAGIGYHYFITEDGNIYQTNRDDIISYHATGYNGRSLGVVITGEHQCSPADDNYLILNKEKYNALVFTLAKLTNKYNLPSSAIIGHTETGSPKSCPNLNMDQLRSDVKKKGHLYWEQNSLSLCA
tara:strand:+ start:629 stop:1177 length:549 start_codon:yes stop_codon:yes gene_type:complete